MLQTEIAIPPITCSDTKDEIYCELEELGTITLAFRDGFFFLEQGENSASVRFGSFDPNASYYLETLNGNDTILRQLVNRFL
ncbi:MAG: hypothetical protein H0U76_18585 [Ktedonobacteraceae bacterium]|nr:hypothetical protein [Ktedonobacteraceae bacterium]